MVAVEIFTREVAMDEVLRDYITKKASKMDRFLPELLDVRVDLAHRPSLREASDRFKAQITLRGPGFILRAEERSDQIQAAYDTAVDNIQRQIERFKGKHHLNKEKRTSITEAFAEPGMAETDDQQLVRRKKFLLRPMDEMEAIEEMQLLGHQDFFVFYNMNASCVSVLYQRNDGSYGLIDTELA
jgi:putative sigma-54 modulation protein